MPALLGLSPAQPLPSGSPILPPGKRRDRFYARFPGREPGPATLKGVEPASASGECGTSGSPRSCRLSFCEETSPLTGLSGACSGRAARSARARVSPRGCRAAWPGRRCSFSETRWISLSVCVAIGPCPHHDRTRFSSQNRSLSNLHDREGPRTEMLSILRSPHEEGPRSSTHRVELGVGSCGFGVPRH